MNKYSAYLMVESGSRWTAIGEVVQGCRGSAGRPEITAATAQLNELLQHSAASHRCITILTDLRPLRYP
jgi:hypothetical protein